MAYYDTQPTPNPNSLKIVTDAGPFIENGLLSFGSEEEAKQHPLGRLLFAVPGVSNVLILPQFLTVTKHPASAWDTLLPKLEAVLSSYFEGRNA